ncbi:MAG: AraC family transcriptional regulator [Spirochaetaceae bacterium]|nr:MAG: AraC family transcriptional regulator [Spirochaetaceae bacterium]
MREETDPVRPITCRRGIYTRHHRTRSFLSRLVISTWALFFVTIFVLSVYFNRVYTDALLQVAVIENTESVMELSRTLERLHTDVVSTFIDLSTSAEVTRFFAEQEFSPIDALAVRRAVSRLPYLRTELQSVSVFNHELDLLVSSSHSNRSPDALRQRNLIRSTNEAWLVVPYRDAVQDRNPTAGYIFRVPFREGADSANAVFFEVEVPGIRPSGDHAAVLDRLGTLVADFDGSFLIHDSDLALVETVIAAVRGVRNADSARTGTVELSWSGIRVSAHFAFTSQGADFFVATIHRTDSIRRLVSQQRARFIWVTLIVFFAGLVTIILVLRQVFKPITSILDAFRINTVHATRANGVTDLEQILQYSTEALDDLRLLRQQDRDYKQLLREKTLYRLMTQPEPMSSFQETLLPGRRAGSFVRVCVVAIDGFKRGGAAVQSYRENWLSAELRKVFAGQEGADVIDDFGGTVLVVFWTRALVQECVDSQFWLPVTQGSFVNINSSLTVAIGPAVDSVSQLQQSYLMAQQCLLARFVLGYGTVIASDTLTALPSSTPRYPDRLDRQCVQAIRLGDRVSLNESIEALREYIESCRPDYAVQVCQVLYASCAKVFFGIAARHGQSYTYHRDPAKDFDSFHRFSEGLVELYNRHQVQRSRTDDERVSRERQAFVEQIQAAVSELYANPNISVEFLAERIGYSANYFGHLYKEYTGSTVNDYIRSVRISHACDLLRQTDFPVRTIAQEVGVASEKHFYYLFKKTKGMTPQQFRNAHAPS